MVILQCRDCENYEERRDIEGIALCAKNIGPHVCCEEFEPRDASINVGRLYNKSCIECANFEDINGFPLCAKNHAPGVACDMFKSRLEKLKIIRQNNHLKTALVAAYTSKNSDPQHIPSFLIETCKRVLLAKAV